MFSWFVFGLGLLLAVASVVVLLRPEASPTIQATNVRVAGAVGLVLGLGAIGITLLGDPVFGLAALVPLIWLGPLALRSAGVMR